MVQFLKSPFVTSNEIVDVGNDHHWMQIPLGDRLMESLILDVSKPVDNPDCTKRRTIRHHVLPGAIYEVQSRTKYC